MNALHENTIDIEPILVDGLYINPETGEVVGEERPEFQVTDEESANWVLEKLMNAEADAAREEMKLRAIQERLNANISRHKRRAEWLRARFGQELELFARAALVDKKERTLKLAFGSIGFRAKKGGLKVVDEEKALAWAKNCHPGAVKVTEKFLISELSPEWRESLSLESNEKGRELAGFVLEQESETCSIKTGVAS